MCVCTWRGETGRGALKERWQTSVQLALCMRAHPVFVTAAWREWVGVLYFQISSLRGSKYSHLQVEYIPLHLFTKKMQFSHIYVNCFLGYKAVLLDFLVWTLTLFLWHLRWLTIDWQHVLLEHSKQHRPHEYSICLLNYAWLH